MRELQDNNNYIVEKVVLIVMVTVTVIVMDVIAVIIIFVYQSIAETRMGNQCAMPAVSITSCIT